MTDPYASQQRPTHQHEGYQPYPPHPTSASRKADMSPSYPPPPPKRLTRSRDDRVLAGVCGGLARYLNLDPTLVRILTVVLALLVGGVPVIVYLVALFIIPEDGQVASGRPPAPRPPVWPAAPAPGAAPSAPGPDPIWGREGAPWEQPQTPAAGQDDAGPRPTV